MSGDAPRVITQRHGRVLLIRMNRPSKRNAVDAAMTQGLDAAFNLLDDDSDLWCGILSGGAQNFCAGTDLVAGPGPKTERGGGYGVVGRCRRKPLVAAVEGFAYGGGLELALTADLVIAGRSAKFGLPEVTHGLVANAGALFRAHQPLPLNIAKQLLLTGRPIDAARAYECGFVSEIVDDQAAEATALEIATTIAANAPLAVQATLHAVDEIAHRDDAAGWDLTRDADDRNRQTRDCAEGLAAFREKRAPNWQAR